MTHAEILKVAKDKAAILFNNSQIRITPEAGIDYWVYNFGGTKYIGYQVDEPMPKFFPKDEYTMVNKRNEPIAKLQKL